MRIVKLCFLSVLSIILVGLMLTLWNGTNALPEEPWIKVSPAVITADPHEGFSVDIIVVDVEDLYGWQFYLEWNATLLNYINVTEGPFLKENTESPEGTQFFYTLYEDEVGKDSVFPGCTTLGDYKGVSGSGTLATVEFAVEAEGYGDTPLHLFDVKLRNHAAVPIEPNDGDPDYYFTNLEDGRFVNVGVPVASFTFSPPSPRVNETIEFDASASYDTTEGGNITAYFWDFGDQTNATETDPFTTHKYEVGKNFQIILTVYDDINLTDTETVWLRIRYDHDVAVLDVSLSRDKVTFGENVSVSITVLVSNEGLEIETFSVTAYHDGTAVGASQDVLNLAAGENKTLSFTLYTGGLKVGSHRAKAVASAVEGEVPAARGNNEKLGGTLTVSEPSAPFPIEIIAVVIVVIVVVVAVVLLWLRKRGS